MIPDNQKKRDKKGRFIKSQNLSLVYCRQCNGTFLVSTYRLGIGGGKYCSIACRAKNVKKGKESHAFGNTYRKGKPISAETKEKLRKINLGKIGFWRGKNRPEITGENHYKWKGGKENRKINVIKRRARKKKAEGGHSLQEWNELKKKFNYMCLCCKKQEPFIKLTEDHIVPLAVGGSNYIENIQPLCRSCNSRKNIKIIDYSCIETLC